MPSIAIKRIIWAVVAVIAAITTFAAVLPFLASTQIVRDRIAEEMSAWSGYRVLLGSAPEIRVWPTFHAVLKDVTLVDWDAGAEPPVLRAERVEIDLSAIAALTGDVAFSRVKLSAPVLRVLPAGKLYLPDAPSGGRLARALEIARAVVKTNPGKPDLAALPSEPFGSIEFTDGRIVYPEDGKTAELVTGMAGTITWSALNRAASLSASGIWRGESVALEASSPLPLLLFAGGSVPLSFSVKSAPLSASFDGTAGFEGGPFFDGSAKIASPSLRRMLEWSRAEVTPGTSIASISVSSKVSGNLQRLKLDSAEVTLDGNPGIGALDVALAGATPSIAGTLAFDTLDLRSFLAAFTPLAPIGEAAEESPIERPAPARHLNLDLRLSVVKATAGPVTLANVAATAQVKDGLSAFDVSDAAVFGGNVQTGVRIDRTASGSMVELRFLASDIDGVQFAKAANLPSLFPQAKATLSLMLKGTGPQWRTVFEGGEGKVSASFGPGKIAGIDLPAFVKRAESGGFFPLREVGGGSLPIDGLEVKATLAQGIARIDKAEAKSGDKTISVSGIVPYLSRGLALSGSLYTTPAAPVAAFFVGGSWDSPFISPFDPVPTPQ